MTEVEKQAEVDANKPVEEEFELTPEVLQRENRRTDLILAGFVLLVAFFLGYFRDAGSDLWLSLRSGQVISESLPAIPKTDSLSYTAEGSPWFNPQWLFDLTLYKLYSAGGEQNGGVVLVIVKCVVLVITAVILLSLRIPGPTLWGTVCLTSLALVASSKRFGLNSDIPALFCLASFLWVWKSAATTRSHGTLLLAIPIAALWANVDLNYFIIPAFLSAFGVGAALELLLGKRSKDQSWGGVGFILLTAVGTALAGLLTPYLLAGPTLRVQWFTQVLNEVALFERELDGWYSIGLVGLIDDLLAFRQSWPMTAWALLSMLSVFAAIHALLTLRFSYFLTLAFAVGFGLLYVRYLGYSAFMMMAVLGLYGQARFRDFFGFQTRIGGGWLLFSQGGRALTIIFIFLTILAAFTGRVQGLFGRFGAGIVAESYPVEAMDWLSEVKPAGKGISFGTSFANYHSWRMPAEKNFLDSRWQVFAGAPIEKYNSFRQSIIEGKSDDYKKIMDEYGVTYLVINPSDPRPETIVILRVLLSLPEFSPVKITDRAVVFARTDKSADSEAFKKAAINPNELVFKEGIKPPTPTDRFTVSPGIIDWIWQTRTRSPANMVKGTVYSLVRKEGTDVGFNFLAVNSLRNAVSANPDNAQGHYRLATAYKNLYDRESAEIAAAEIRFQEAYDKSMQAKEAAKGKDPAKKDPPAKPVEAVDKNAKPVDNADASKAAKDGKGDPKQNPVRVLQTIPARGFLEARHFQIISEFQNAVLAGPNDAETYFDFYSYALKNQMFDLALEQLNKGLRKPMTAENREKAIAQYRRPLEEEVAKRTAQFDAYAKQFEAQAGEGQIPEGEFLLWKAKLAYEMGLTQKAMECIDSLSPSGQDRLRGATLGLVIYMMSGEIEKANSLLLNELRERRLLPPGEWEWWSAQVNICSGQFEEASKLIEQAIAELRASEVNASIVGLEILSRGNDAVDAGELLLVPNQINRTLSSQARERLYQFVLGLVQIELGKPKDTAKSFKKVLLSDPRDRYRPIMALYAKYIGETLPDETSLYDYDNEFAVKYPEAPASPTKEKDASKKEVVPTPAPKPAVEVPASKSK